MDPSNAVTDEAKARKERENFIVDFLDVDNRSNRIIVGNENCDLFRDKKERCFFSRIASMIFSPTFCDQYLVGGFQDRSDIPRMTNGEARFNGQKGIQYSASLEDPILGARLQYLQLQQPPRCEF